MFPICVYCLMFLDLFILLSVHEHSARMDVDAP